MTFPKINTRRDCIELATGADLDVWAKFFGLERFGLEDERLRGFVLLEESRPHAREGWPPYGVADRPPTTGVQLLDPCKPGYYEGRYCGVGNCRYPHHVDPHVRRPSR